MSSVTKPLPDFEQMALELERVANQIRTNTRINHHFAERIELLAKQMRLEGGMSPPLKLVSQK